MNKTRILAVNDVVILLRMLDIHVENQGIPVLIDKATNGQEAVEKAKKENYDAILMNLEMPVMNGWQATQAIRKLGVTTPIIAWSGHDKDYVVEACMKVGMDDYLEIAKGDFLNDIFYALERVGVKV